MFTTFDKAITAGLVPALSAIIFWVLTEYFAITLPPEIQAAVITVLTAALVWLVPNKPATAGQ
jgi:hypothetical protein